MTRDMQIAQLVRRTGKPHIRRALKLDGTPYLGPQYEVHVLARKGYSRTGAEPHLLLAQTREQAYAQALSMLPMMQDIFNRRKALT